jgi:hypothetical protein
VQGGASILLECIRVNAGVTKKDLDGFFVAVHACNVEGGEAKAVGPFRFGFGVKKKGPESVELSRESRLEEVLASAHLAGEGEGGKGQRERREKKRKLVFATTLSGFRHDLWVFATTFCPASPSGYYANPRPPTCSPHDFKPVGVTHVVGGPLVREI